MYRTFQAGGGEWRKVELPLDPNSWKSVGKQVELSIGQASQLQWYPFRAMDNPGEYMTIDGLKFLPKLEGEHPIAVQGYKHVAPPSLGDDDGKALTDGKVEKEAQGWWRQFSDLPDITFDLGGIYLVDKVVLQALAVPSQNLSGFILSSSMDGETWQPVASVKNADERAVEALHALEGKNLKAVGTVTFG